MRQYEKYLPGALVDITKNETPMALYVSMIQSRYHNKPKRYKGYTRRRRGAKCQR